MAELDVTATGARALSGINGTPAGGTRDVVQLRLPAAGAYLSVLRTATAGLASRLDFTIDDIEDLRIAVDEACAMLLAQAVPGADLECRFELTADAIDVAVSVLTLDGEEPSRDTFAWTVLTALAGEVDSSVDADLRVTLTPSVDRRLPHAHQLAQGLTGQGTKRQQVDAGGGLAQQRGLASAPREPNAWWQPPQQQPERGHPTERPPEHVGEGRDHLLLPGAGALDLLAHVARLIQWRRQLVPDSRNIIGGVRSLVQSLGEVVAGRLDAATRSGQLLGRVVHGASDPEAEQQPGKRQHVCQHLTRTPARRLGVPRKVHEPRCSRWGAAAPIARPPADPCARADRAACMPPGADA